MVKKLFLSLGLLCLFFGSISAQDSHKSPIKSERDINTYCTKISSSSPLCQRWFEIRQKRLEVKSLIYKDIKDFCSKNPKEKFCQKSFRSNLFLFCTKILPQNPNCQLWQELKQAELETKGLLSEEISQFCRKYPENSFCK
ncbi:hypothetical protein THC_0581 [Caldimicrobium thiodismutans]|jgi:hypothetical protein|uniref:Uncharacterized protein n=1 Tax=Caldimicrobium thiodismutans TaxID=1653476 RepID=A0A0U5AX17_9BACT|nr:hypothetical protein [Caldimicrobium thiodismutans]BAU22975.1 hypothetical protein THC_0581 [Caldimicrobium thiodismutans]